MPTHGPEIRHLLEPLCDVRHELEPEEILHELVMTEFIEIADSGAVHYNEARLMHRETNWYAIAAMVVLLLSVSAALLEAMGRR